MKARKMVIAAAAIIAAAGWLAAARPAVAGPGEESEQQALTLNAGESKVIGHIRPGSTPAIRVLRNPHALVIHGESSGEVVLLGAERGVWEVKVDLDDGRTVSYRVTVNAVADAGKRLEPGVSPPASGPAPLSSVSGALPDLKSATAGAPLTPPSLPAGASAGGLKATTVPGLATGAEIDTAATPHDSAGAGLSGAPQAPVAVSQTGNPVAGAAARFRVNPSVAASGGHFTSPSVSGGPNYLPPEGLSLMAGTLQIIDFPRRLKRIAIADSSIADIQVVNPYQLNLVAHKAGFTTLAVWDERGHYEERQIRIDPGGKQQVMLNVVVAELNRTNLENQGINYSVALANYGVSLVGLPGPVATPYSQQSTTGGSATLPAGGGIIPLLLSQNLTYGLAAQNSNVLTQSLFQYLEQHNLGRVLAEPHLLANSGEEAKFLSGGEIPIVIAQALNTTIVFKQFGTSVVFLPTVVGSRDIELLVKPEVSQPDYAHGVQMFGFQVPAFITRRAETLVRLRDSQTLIIAGLILHQKQAVVQKVPYLGDIPFAGGLFRNTNWQVVETDLVMAVTPQIVNPLPPAGRVFLPTERGPLSHQEIRTRRLAEPDAARPRF